MAPEANRRPLRRRRKTGATTVAAWPSWNGPRWTFLLTLRLSTRYNPKDREGKWSAGGASSRGGRKTNDWRLEEHGSAICRPLRGDAVHWRIQQQRARRLPPRRSGDRAQRPRGRSRRSAVRGQRTHARISRQSRAERTY